MKFAIGDSVWYDTSHGVVQALMYGQWEDGPLAFHGYGVRWDSGAWSVVREGDLMTDAEQAEF